jgi:transcription initiation factor IIE alpha subunit
MKYCCGKFKIDVGLPNTTKPNIRIVKVLPRADYQVNSPYYFFITMGYEKFNLDLPMSSIRYCPYCGVNLFEFYKSDEYANEMEGKTFGL